MLMLAAADLRSESRYNVFQSPTVYEKTEGPSLLNLESFLLSLTLKHSIGEPGKWPMSININL